MNINEEIEREKNELIPDEEPAEESAEVPEDTAEGDDVSDDDLNYEPIIGTYTHDDMFEQLIAKARECSAERAAQELSEDENGVEDNGADMSEESIDEADGGDGKSAGEEESLTEEEDFSEEFFPDTPDTDADGEIEPNVDEPDIPKETEEAEKQSEASKTDTEGKEKSKSGGLTERIKNSEVLKPAVIKEMFFGSRDSEHRFAPDDSEIDEDDEYEDPVEFDRSRRRRSAADPERDKKIFSIEYMLDPELAADGYMLFYNEFVLKKNIKMTLILGFLALIFLFSVIISPKGYLNYTLLLITLSMIAMRWINSSGAKRDALLSAEDVKNDSYRLDFYNSRILLKASEIVGDKIYSYPPVMIRFEDIELKVLDYEELYVLIFKKNYVYTVPKSAMSEEQKAVFKGMLENILGDDYYEFYSREKEAEERAEKRRMKKESKVKK